MRRIAGVVVGVLLLAGTLAGTALCEAATWFIPGDFPDLRTAYDNVDAHDTLIVRPGYYSGDNWTELFFFNKPVRIIAQGGPSVTTLDGRGIDRAMHFRDLPDNTMLVEGFTITNCVGDLIGAVNFHENSAGTLRNCIIENCRATEQNLPVPGEGGGLRIWGASPVIEDVIIRNCHAMQGGGCNILDVSAPVFRRVLIENCSGGGLMSSDSTNPYFEDCQFINNTESMYSFVAGVGIYIGSRGHFVRCLFKDNHNLTGPGGGVHVGDSTTVFDHCVFIGNSAASHAGGIMCHHGATPVFNYCTIVGNSAGGNGDGIGVFLSSLPAFNNCILWQPGREIYAESGASATFSNCDLSSPIPGSDNFSEDPMFTGTGDYHIQPLSPCRDRGLHRGERIDIDGDWSENPDETWDVGADEYFVFESEEIAIDVQMPARMFHPGDTCGLGISVDNPGSGIYLARLVVVLDVYGTAFFWPSWGSSLDHSVVSIPSGTSQIVILPDFTWPENTGSADNLFFHSGILTLDMTELLSNINSFEFGWADNHASFNQSPS